MSEFNYNDRVKIKRFGSTYGGQYGVVRSSYINDTAEIALDNGEIVTYYDNELEIVGMSRPGKEDTGKRGYESVPAIKDMIEEMRRKVNEIYQ
jgi:hypothetical protein